VPYTIVSARPSASPALTEDQLRQLAILDEILASGEGALRVAVEEGSRVGHMLVFLRMSAAVATFVDAWNPDRPGTPERLARERSGYVTDVMVLETHRRRGVATMLLHDAAELARAAGLSRLVLHVAPDNHAALRLYDKLGFMRGEDAPTSLEFGLTL
jgi:ribosomal protein S18 acetylase RimI-like enzyme